MQGSAVLVAAGSTALRVSGPGQDGFRVQAQGEWAGGQVRRGSGGPGRRWGAGTWPGRGQEAALRR